MTRRDFVVATAGLAGLIGPMLLDASVVQGTASDDQAREIYRRAIVIDGLLPDDFLSVLGRPAPPESPLFSQTQLDTVMRSGLTGGNLTVSGGTFEGSARSIAQWMGRVEAHSSHFMFIRKHSDLARAKQDGKLGLILGFQNATMVSRDLADVVTFRQLGDRKSVV